MSQYQKTWCIDVQLNPSSICYLEWAKHMLVYRSPQQSTAWRKTEILQRGTEPGCRVSLVHMVALLHFWSKSLHRSLAWTLNAVLRLEPWYSMFSSSNQWFNEHNMLFLSQTTCQYIIHNFPLTSFRIWLKQIQCRHETSSVFCNYMFSNFSTTINKLD